MDAATPIHRNTIRTTKGLWQISVCSALIVSKDVIVLRLERKSDSGLDARVLILRLPIANLAGSERLIHVLNRIRNWIELTEESDAELDLSQDP